MIIGVLKHHPGRYSKEQLWPMGYNKKQTYQGYRYTCNIVKLLRDNSAECGL